MEKIFTECDYASNQDCVGFKACTKQFSTLSVTDVLACNRAPRNEFQWDVTNWTPEQFNQLRLCVDQINVGSSSDLLQKIQDRHVLVFYTLLLTLGRNAVKKLYSRAVVYRYANRLKLAGISIDGFHLLGHFRAKCASEKPGLGAPAPDPV